MKILLIPSFLFTVLFTLATGKLYAQDEGENPLPYVNREPVYDTAPEFPGGSENLRRYFNDNIRYPEPEKTKGKEGNVSVKFMVSTEGKIFDVKVINGVPGAPNLAREAERVIQDMPDWKPATKKGKPVEAEYYYSIPFRIRTEWIREKDIRK